MYDNFQKEGCNFKILKFGFFVRVEPEIIMFIEIVTSFNIPGGTLKIIHQIRSRGFLVIKTLHLPVFGFQKTVSLFGLKYRMHLI